MRYAYLTVALWYTACGGGSRLTKLRRDGRGESIRLEIEDRLKSDEAAQLRRHGGGEQIEAEAKVCDHLLQVAKLGRDRRGDRVRLHVKKVLHAWGEGWGGEGGRGSGRG